MDSWNLLNDVEAWGTLGNCSVMLKLVVIRNMEMSYEVMNGTVLTMKLSLYMADVSVAYNMYILT